VDNLTHSLAALTFANAGLRRAGRGATAALLIGSNIPDIEIFTTITGGRVAYLAAHRGPTHGLLGLPLALLTAAVVWLYLRARRQPAAECASFASLVAMASIGVVGHIAMDFATSYGTRVLSPFVDTWFGVDWMPIIDIYLLAILLVGLLVTAARPAWRSRIAAIVMLLTAGDYLMRAGAHEAALKAAVARQETRLAAGASERPGTVFHYLNTSHPSAVPAALPTLLSPFRWRVITRTPRGFEVGEVNLLSPHAVVEPIAFPDEAGPTIDRASAAPLAQVFLDFSRFPAAETIRHRDGNVTVHWYDLRFAERAEDEGDGRRHTSPFAVWIRLSPTGAVLGQGLGPG
jgi:membrane-bound metal-dependent hydrolase YbcI (DUF457 family)